MRVYVLANICTNPCNKHNSKRPQTHRSQCQMYVYKALNGADSLINEARNYVVTRGIICFRKAGVILWNSFLDMKRNVKLQ